MSTDQAMGDEAMDTEQSVLRALLEGFELWWPADCTGLAHVQRYALVPPGKLLRPRLLLHAALSCHGELDQVLPAAVGIEAAHVGSLLHDDVIDGDHLRRGRPAVHAVYGADRAIVAGNALFFTWFALLAEAGRRGVRPHLLAMAAHLQAEAGIKVCQGVHAEQDMIGKLDCGVEAYLTMVAGKTAALMAAACAVGATLAAAPAPAVEALTSYGHNLGMAFQIRDDLLAYHDDPAGKPAASDLRNRRPTLPVLLARHQADAGHTEQLTALFGPPIDPPSARCNDTARLKQLRDLITATGGDTAAAAMADTYAQAADQALNALPPGPHRDALSALTSG